MKRLLPSVAVTGLVVAVSGLAVSAAVPAAAAGAPHEKPFSGPLPGGYKHLVVIYEENHSFDNLYGGWGRVGGKRVNGLQNADRRAHHPGRPRTGRRTAACCRTT